MRALRPDGTIVITADEIYRAAQFAVEGRATSLEPRGPIRRAAAPPPAASGAKAMAATLFDASGEPELPAFLDRRNPASIGVGAQ